VAGAHVSIPGYAEEAVTNEMGNFALPAHAAGDRWCRSERRRVNSEPKRMCRPRGRQLS